MANKTVGILVGSLRKGSFSRCVAQYIASAIPAGYTAKLVDISDVPLYNEDLDEGTPPPQWVRLREEIKALNGVLFVTPEYNRSVPAVLKNALDVASRPYGQSAWDKKPGGIISVSPGKLSAFGANHHLRQSMVFLNVYMMQQPEAYVGNIADSLDKDGNVTDERTQKFLAGYAQAFAAWMEHF